MDIAILEHIGLSKNEIKVYFALLELDQSSATPIIKKAKIPNSKVYPTLEKLIHKGLVSFVIKNNVKHFQASNPENLIEFIHKKEIQLSVQKDEIKKMIPFIEQKRKHAKDKQESMVYEDIQGVKVALNEILNTLKEGEEYYVFTLGQELATKQLRLFFSHYHKKRIEKKVNVKLIGNRDMKKTFEKHHIYKNMKIRYTDLKLPTGIFIFNGHVMTIVWEKKPTAFIIKSKNNYGRYKEFFEEMWKSAIS